MRSSEFGGSLETSQLLNNENVDLINEKITGFYIVLPFPIEDKTEPLTYIDAGVGNIRTGLRQMATKYGPNFYFTYHEEQYPGKALSRILKAFEKCRPHP